MRSGLRPEMSAVLILNFPALCISSSSPFGSLLQHCLNKIIPAFAIIEERKKILISVRSDPDPGPKTRIRIRIRPKNPDPTGSGSGSATLGKDIVYVLDIFSK